MQTPRRSLRAQVGSSDLSPGSRAAGGTSPPTAPFVLLFFGVVAVGLELVRPFRTAPIAFDTAASVLQFERIASGRHLEALITTTPKPLLTVVDGLLYVLTGDWRPLSLATLAAFAGAVAIASYVAARLDGWLAAGLVAVGLAASRGLWVDVGLTLAVALALLGLAVAGIAVTSRRPRYGVAGVAILLASLARVESLVLVPIAAAALGWAATHGPINLRPAPRTWLVPLIPALTVPIMAVHDWMLTGDPLYWTEVAQRYSAAVRAPVLSPAAMVAALASHGVAEFGFLVLGALGILRLARARSPALAVGLVGMCLGVSALLVLLAARHLYVPERYFLLIDAGLIVAAGFGASALADSPRLASVRARIAVLRPISRGLAAAGAGTAVAIVLGWPVASFDPVVRSTIRNQSRLAEHFAVVLPAIRTELSAPALEAGVADGPPVHLLVPLALLPRAAVDTGLSLRQVAATQAADIDPGRGSPAAGQMVFHDRLGDPASGAFRSIEVVTPTPEGPIVVRPLKVDPAAGYWLVLITRGP